MFSATFSNISAISWRPVLVVEENLYISITTKQRLHSLYIWGFIIRKEIITINMNGEDKEKNKLKTGAPYFAYELKEEVFPF
jgi:hypothetical protein